MVTLKSTTSVPLFKRIGAGVWVNGRGGKVGGKGEYVDGKG